jgi:hypothetical protein
MVKLTPEHQHEFTRNEPEAFICVKGAWGKQGCTNVLLPAAKESSVKAAIEFAWRNASANAPKRFQGRRRGAT